MTLSFFTTVCVTSPVDFGCVALSICQETEHLLSSFFHEYIFCGASNSVGHRVGQTVFSKAVTVWQM